MITSLFLPRIRSNTSDTAPGRGSGRPRPDHEHEDATMAAPAECASSADAAICSGVTGTCAFFLTESPEPVTAQVIKTALVNIAADFASESRISEAL